MTGKSGFWRIAVRLLGAGVMALGGLMLLSDLHITGGGLAYRPAALGEVWHNWHAPSLNLLQAIVERYVLPQLWSYALLPLLLAPAWIVAAAKGIILVAFSHVRISAHKAASPSR